MRQEMSPGALRKRAQAYLKKGRPEELSQEQKEDISRLLEELSVYQIELEMQNQELKETWHKLEEEKEKYRSLYLHAPVIYFTMNSWGNILDLNEAAAAFLGKSRHIVNRSSIFPYLGEEAKTPFRKLLERAVSEKRTQGGAISLIDGTGEYREVRVQVHPDTPADTDEPVCRVTMTDISEEKNEIREGTSRFKEYVNTSLDIFFEIDLYGTIQFISQAVLPLLGYPPESVLGTDFRRVLHEEDRRRIDALFSELTAAAKKPEEPQLELEVRLRHADGSWRYHHAKGSLWINSRGEAESVFVVSRDITERNQIEEELYQREQEYRSYLDNAPYGVIVADSKGKVIGVNPAMEELSGYPRNALESMHISDLLPPDSQSSEGEIMQELHRNGKVRKEVRILSGEGRERWLSVSVVSLAGGKILGFHEDITMKKRAHDQLLAVMEGLEVGIFILNPNSKEVLYANHYLKQLLPEDPTGKNCITIFGNQDEICKRCLQFGLDHLAGSADSDTQMQPYEYHLPGGGKWLLIRSAPIRWRNGQTMIMKTLTDITPLKEMEQLRDDMTRITRHDIKSPLSGVIGVAQLMAEGDFSAEQYKTYGGMILESGRKILSIIDQSLDLYKMETGTYTLTPEKVSLVPLIEGILTEFDSDLKYKEIAVSLDAPPSRESENWTIQGEALLSYSLFSNLIKNAIEASVRKDELSIKLEKEGQGMIQTVIRNSRPVPEEIREHFGQKYASSGKKHGTGLGIYSAKLMARTQGGSFSWESSAEKGTAVSVMLPAAENLSHP